MSFDDYELDDLPCPACEHPITHSRRCPQCDDGLIDMYDEDPICFSPGEMERCGECDGTGIQRWCPKCGEDYWEAIRKRAATAIEIEPGMFKVAVDPHLCPTRLGVSRILFKIPRETRQGYTRWRFHQECEEDGQRYFLIKAERKTP